MLSRTFRAICLVPLLGLGCSQPPDLSADIELLGNNMDDVIALTCDCHVDAGFATMLECEEALGEVGDVERQCVADTLVGYETEGKDYLNCANDAYSDYLFCLELNENACEDGGIAACDEANTQALVGCTQLPDGVLASVAACTS